MKTKELIKEIEKLPVQNRIIIAEKILKSIRSNKSNTDMEKAASLLMDEYKNNQELTAMTALDSVDFHETR